jgi:hypothetical protein
LQNFLTWQRKSLSNSIRKPLLCVTLKLYGTAWKKARGWYCSHKLGVILFY